MILKKLRVVFVLDIRDVDNTRDRDICRVEHQQRTKPQIKLQGAYPVVEELMRVRILRNHDFMDVALRFKGMEIMVGEKEKPRLAISSIHGVGEQISHVLLHAADLARDDRQQIDANPQSEPPFSC